MSGSADLFAPADTPRCLAHSGGWSCVLPLDHAGGHVVRPDPVAAPADVALLLSLADAQEASAHRFPNSGASIQGMDRASRLRALAAALGRITPEVVREATAQLHGYVVVEDPDENGSPKMGTLVRSPLRASCAVAAEVLAALAPTPETTG